MRPFSVNIAWPMWKNRNTFRKKDNSKYLLVPATS